MIVPSLLRSASLCTESALPSEFAMQQNPYGLPHYIVIFGTFGTAIVEALLTHPPSVTG